VQANSQSAFAQHDLDRDRLLGAIADLKAAYTFNPSIAPVSENVKNLGMRLGDMLTDIIAMTQVLTIVDDAVRPGAEQLEDSNVPADVRLNRFIASANHELPAIDRLAVVYKAIFFLFRALQDVQYATLLELVGQRAGSGTSMSKCFKSRVDTISNNPIYPLIATKIPRYETWFKRFREIRNDLKAGRAHGLATTDGRILITINLQQGNVSNRVTTIGFYDVTEAIEMSAALFRLMKDLCQTMSKAI
jgi:hypothetical protein